MITRLAIAMTLFLAVDGTGLPAAGGDDPASEIRGVLRQQVEAWNRGDIDAFMEHYWKSDELTFSSGGQTTRGWQSTKDNYKRRYPTREKMGQLALSDLEITPLGENASLVLGRWRLSRDESPIGGNFTLVFRRVEGKWIIIHDHTSRAEPPNGP
jgi:beta-aspartyl-peptidase (threonine type)